MFLIHLDILICSFQGTLTAFAVSGDKGIRTLDPLLARQVLSQLSYTPMVSLFYSFLCRLQSPALPLTSLTEWG